MGSHAGLFHYALLGSYTNFRTSYKCIEGISYIIRPGEWICTLAELTQWFRMYNNVYGMTDIQYDLQSNKVKESVVLESYDPNLRGFRYTLAVGELVPALNDDGSIDFYDAKEENIIMTMPAPFLQDDAMATSDDVRVTLTGSGSSYNLVYLLPQSWLADEGRSWPVILDPVVQADPNALTNLQDRTVAKNGSYVIDDVHLYCGYQTSVPVATSSWVRAEVSFTNDTNQSLSVAAYVFVPGSGTTDVDCVQVEKMPAASRYNMIQNADFRSNNDFWEGSDGGVVNAKFNVQLHIR